MTFGKNYLCVCRAGRFASAVTALCTFRTNPSPNPNLSLSHKSPTREGGRPGRDDDAGTTQPLLSATNISVHNRLFVYVVAVFAKSGPFENCCVACGGGGQVEVHRRRRFRFSSTLHSSLLVDSSAPFSLPDYPPNLDVQLGRASVVWKKEPAERCGTGEQGRRGLLRGGRRRRQPQWRCCWPSSSSSWRG